MHKFKDNSDTEWSLSLNGYQLKKLKERIGFDARDHESIFKAANDPALLCDVLFLLCEDQAKEKGISDRQFGEAMTGDAIDAAATAYLEESVDFFPQRQRQSLRMALAKITELQTQKAQAGESLIQSPKVMELMILDIQNAELAVDELIAKGKTELAKKREELLAGTTTGNSSGKSPA